ncbi:tRNA (uridine(54)-C5)-methyltransferase TrmA [Gilvimarinus agarilyticus]|uniref:tRNA (uridine(54)-C5)-methyltransferase TrmA n=1 Tax=Gilvimarinus sp. 2_MG-2023 TaxID=3062666 RepID=UPI001C090B7E|nr:tRNA (uridine(54)-C5)-methyltransferase TrmA [Gilvimarinus sp. 2_MG-2023]MBU2887155.1 tRNA (uridine(54)-C5)-methyltransferase TrmA [Gilvimarinus agarilyticus]MDO6571814.1 tRNA (uridine(54)-C5)-methyltransferase TrmA [Gilvimarinus sp. 2_MG-2023]
MTIVPFSDESYPAQLDEKLNKVRRLLSDTDIPEPEVYESPASGYRMRAEFKVWQEGSTAFYAMYKKGEYKTPYLIEEFTPGYHRINELMPRLLAEINQSETLRKRLFQAEFLTTLAGETVITLIYHKKLDDAWHAEAEALTSLLSVSIIGRSRKQKVIIGRDYVIEKLSVLGREYTYQQIESSFTQPNAVICQKMLTWAVEKSLDIGGDLLELYCGNGNFTLPLAQNFDKVLATEISKVSVNSALYNMRENNVENINVVRMSSEDFSQALDNVRPFRRLKDIALEDYNFTTIFVDPPRAGLDEHTTEVAKRFQNIMYISCNPETMARDIQAMSASHKVVEFAVFDQFPFTDHIECGAVLMKR